MTSNDCTKNALERMLAINWTRQDKRMRSHVALVEEYLRRAALWAESLHAVNHWPFFDVAASIEPNERADSSSISTLENALAKKGLRSSIKNVCINYLHWQHLKDSTPERIAGSNLPEPYEPLILLFERGGIFYPEHGYINVFTVGIPVMYRGCQAYESSVPVVLDEDVLDALDVESEAAART